MCIYITICHRVAGGPNSQKKQVVYHPAVLAVKQTMLPQLLTITYTGLISPHINILVSMLALANILFLPPPSVVIYISLQSKSKVGDAAVLPPVIIGEFTGKGINYSLC